MTREEYLKMEKEAQEQFEKMSSDEKEAFLAAQKRHARKVSDEIITSHEMRNREEQKGESDEESSSSK